MTEIDYQAIEAYALAEVAKHAPELETAALVNTEKVITAFRNNMVSDYTFVAHKINETSN